MRPCPQNPPIGIRVIEANALDLDLPEGSFDIVLVSTVFTSILDSEFQERLATKIWVLVKPGGAVLWYDFIFDNPANPDVKGMPRRRVLELFPQAKVSTRKITLAPPIARAVCRFHPGLYSAFNLFSSLRTHLVGWLEKPLGKPAAGEAPPCAVRARPEDEKGSGQIEHVTGGCPGHHQADCRERIPFSIGAPDERREDEGKAQSVDDEANFLSAVDRCHFREW